MNYKLDWHPASIAEQWPRGSTVVMRRKRKDKTHYEYEHFLAECFFPSFVQDGYEYILLESPKENNDRTNKD